MQSRRVLPLTGALVAVATLTLAAASPAAAHVKWFSDFDFRDPPRTLGEVIDTPFVILLVVATAAMALLPALDRWLETLPPYQAINDWLSSRRDYSVRIVRYSMAAVLLITWASEALLTPELAEPVEWVGWLEFWMALALLAGRGDRIAGGGLFVLWLIGVYQYGAFHMLDYMHILGIGTFLLLHDHQRTNLRGLALPTLYLTVGFSLMWLGFEKLVYPEWSFAILETRPILRLGLPAEFFLDMAAFVEIGLGFLLIIGLLGRPLAVVITIVFILTTIVFGRVEIIGHTPVHAALIVFLLHGPGSVYPAPIAIHGKIGLRTAFAAVNFLLLVAVTGALYTEAARAQFDDAVAEQGPKPPPVEVTGPLPTIESVLLVPTPTGTDIELELSNWTFAPPTHDGAASSSSPTEGFGILSRNGQVIARIDGDRSPLWRQVDDGTAVLELFTTDGSQLEMDGEPIRLEIELRNP